MGKRLCIIPVFFSLLSFGQDENIYYKSGKLNVQKKFDKTCNCTKVVEYYENGKVLSKKTYLNIGSSTVIDGEDIRYFENGKIQIYTFWKKGIPDGRTYCNYSNGQLTYEKFYANKFKSGTWKFYYQNGSLAEEIIYNEQKTAWDSNEDNAIHKFYYNNVLAYTINLVEGKKTNLTIINKEGYSNLAKPEKLVGEDLFTENCSMCHSAEIDIVGPRLNNVANRRKTIWLKQMIKNGDLLMKSGDKDAIDLYEKWNRVQHPNFEILSDEQVQDIIDYLTTLK